MLARDLQCSHSSPLNLEKKKNKKRKETKAESRNSHPPSRQREKKKKGPVGGDRALTSKRRGKKSKSKRPTWYTKAKQHCKDVTHVSTTHTSPPHTTKIEKQDRAITAEPQSSLTAQELLKLCRHDGDSVEARQESGKSIHSIFFFF